MNFKGQIMLYGLMMAILIVVVALALAPSIKQFTDNSRNGTTWDGADGLNCSTSIVNTSIQNISIYDKATCITTDALNWYFIGFLIFIGVAFLTAKIIIE